tara:strand:- start:43 stop:570 length:528 start_codon:yes stop_codon:yes gene_type:complete
MIRDIKVKDNKLVYELTCNGCLKEFDRPAKKISNTKAVNHFCDDPYKLRKCQNLYKQNTSTQCEFKECTTLVREHNKSKLCTVHRKGTQYRRYKAELYEKLGNKCSRCNWFFNILHRLLKRFEVDHVFDNGSKLRKLSSTHQHPKNLLKYLLNNPNHLQLLCPNHHKEKTNQLYT